MTLDQAQEQFEAKLTKSAAMAYRETAEQYFEDDMIGENELKHVQRKTASYLGTEDYLDATKGR